MAYKCTWCKDTGKYYPLQGPAEPCRECAAFVLTIPEVRKHDIKGACYLNSITAVPTVQAPDARLWVMNLSHEECRILRERVPFSGSGLDACNRTQYIATWKEHVPQILTLLGWNALDTRMHIDGEHWVMEHKISRNVNFMADTFLLNPNALHSTPEQ